MKKIAIFFLIIIAIIVSITYMVIDYQNKQSKLQKENQVYERKYAGLFCYLKGKAVIHRNYHHVVGKTVPLRRFARVFRHPFLANQADNRTEGGVHAAPLAVQIIGTLCGFFPVKRFVRPGRGGIVFFGGAGASGQQRTERGGTVQKKVSSFHGKAIRLEVLNKGTLNPAGKLQARGLSVT